MHMACLQSLQKYYWAAYKLEKNKCWHIVDSIALVFKDYMYCFPVF